MAEGDETPPRTKIFVFSVLSKITLDTGQKDRLFYLSTISKKRFFHKDLNFKIRNLMCEL